MKKLWKYSLLILCIGFYLLPSSSSYPGKIRISTNKTTYAAGFQTMKVIVVNLSNHAFTYGTPYKIQHSHNGKWTPLSFSKSIPSVCQSSAIYVASHSQNEQVIHPNWFYDPLPTGKYRIVKEINHRYYATDPFEITGSA